MVFDHDIILESLAIILLHLAREGEREGREGRQRINLVVVEMHVSVRACVYISANKNHCITQAYKCKKIK